VNRTPARSGAIAGLLLALASLPATAQSAASSPASPDRPLAFFGFEAGAPLADVAARLKALDGSRLRCDRAHADSHVTECRATVGDPALGGPVNLWMSAIDSLSGVMTLSADVSPDQLDTWRSALEKAYGKVGAQVQGTQWMMQWVRRGRMIRLTWRTENGNRVASVSLIDGHVLDAWGRGRARARG
jgi:hypothetical protein